MVTLKSKGGKKQTPAENNLELVKAGFKFLVIVGSVVAIIFGVNWLFDRGKESEQKASCAPIVENSVFTTGDPLMDYRLLTAISADKSPQREISGKLVTHVWEEKNFSFKDAQVQKHWDMTLKEVTQLPEGKVTPYLSITNEGIIVPFATTSDTQTIEWTSIPLENSLPAQTSNFLMVSRDVNGKESTPVPTVLLSLNGKTTVPSPNLGAKSQVEVLDQKKVCE